MGVLTFLLCLQATRAFQVSPSCSNNNNIAAATPLIGNRYQQISCRMSSSADGNADDDPDEIITASIKVSGDVGGYYRACVLNEAGKFRGLVGTMSPPDDRREAEI